MTQKISCFDPRDPDQDISNPETWRLTSNPALIAGKFAIDLAKINGLKLRGNFERCLSDLADFCDQPIKLTRTFRGDGTSFLTDAEGNKMAEVVPMSKKEMGIPK